MAIYNTPDGPVEFGDLPEEQVLEILRNKYPPTAQQAPQQMPQQGGYSPLAIGGEFSNAANRTVMDTLDFLGPGTVNAAARVSNDMFGTDFGQMPTFAGGFNQLPGSAGGFMPEGVGRDITRAAGATLPAAGGLAPVAGRSLATGRGAIEEILGFGTQKAPSASVTASQAPNLSGDLTGGPATNILERAAEMGWPLSFGDRTGNRTIKAIESGIESAPMVSNPINRINDQRQRILQRVAAESVGEPRDARLTQDAVGDVADRLSNEFTSLVDLDQMPAGGQFIDDLIGVQDASRNRLFTDPQIDKTVNKIFDKIDDTGNMSVPDYQDMSSELKAKARQAWKGESPDPYFAESLGELVDALDDLAVDSVSPTALAKLKKARTQWRALSQLEKSRAIHESGDISGPLLANYLRRTDKGGYGRGKNTTPLYEAARLSKAFPSRPDSGTAGRQFINNLLQNPVSGGIGLALSPIVSTAANAFVRGPSAARSVGRLAGGGGAPLRTAARFGGSLFEREAEAEEEARGYR